MVSGQSAGVLLFSAGADSLFSRVHTFSCLLDSSPGNVHDRDRMRVLSEHPPAERASAYRVIYSYRLSLIERILFAPKNCYYHIEHHSRPSVPFFNLPRLRRELEPNPGYRAALQPVTYWELLKSLSSPSARGNAGRALSR